MTAALFDPPEAPPPAGATDLALILAKLKIDAEADGGATAELPGGLRVRLLLREHDPPVILLARGQDESPPSSLEADLVARDAGWWPHVTTTTLTLRDGRTALRLTRASPPPDPDELTPDERRARQDAILSVRHGLMTDSEWSMRAEAVRAMNDHELRDEYAWHVRRVTCILPPDLHAAHLIPPTPS